MQLKNLFESLRLSREAKTELKQVLSLPEVKAVLEREQERDLAHRVELRKRLVLVPDLNIRQREDAATAFHKATAAVATAAANLLQAKKDEAAAMVALYAADLQHRTYESGLLQELYDGRDLRLDDLRRQIERVADEASNACKIWVVAEKSFDNSVRYGGNIETCQATAAVLRGLLLEVSGLCHEALSRNEMTAKITTICRKAQGALDPLQILGPTIDKAGEVKAPAPVRVVEADEKTAA